jgi:AcrR family transcriptional regulator
VAFYRQGIGAVGVDSVVAEAGVAKATLYRHFRSKDDLVVAFLRRRDLRWREWLSDSVERLAPRVEDRPLAVFDALGEWFASGGFREGG